MTHVLDAREPLHTLSGNADADADARDGACAKQPSHCDHDAGTPPAVGGTCAPLHRDVETADKRTRTAACLLVPYRPLANLLAVDEKRAPRATDTQAQRLGHAPVLQTTRPAAPFAQRTPRAAPVTARGPLPCKPTARRKPWPPAATAPPWASSSI